jgi:hypothetical protein
MGRSSSQLFRALAGAQHSGGSVGPRVADEPADERSGAPGWTCRVRKSQASTLSVHGLADETARERATGIEPA